MSLADYLKSADSDMRRVRDVVNGIYAVFGGTAANTGNAYTLTPSVPIDRYSDGQTFRFFVAANNTGAATLAVSNAGAKSIRMGETGLALAADDLSTGYLYEAYYREADDRFYLSTPWVSGTGGGGGGGEVPYVGGTSDIRLAHQFVSTDGIASITRSSGRISNITFASGYELDITRDVDGTVLSWTDGTNTWTINRTGDEITGITVT